VPWTETEHPDADALAAACATRLERALDGALKARRSAVLALAGGRTAPPILQRLAAEPRKWTHVTILPSDERWVAADHADSNLRQLRQAFALAPGIRWLALVPPRPAGAADAKHANWALKAVADPFDAVLLGMGADGHFASLFPGAPNLALALDPGAAEAAVAIVPDPMPSAGPHPRVSLTLARLLNSRRVLLALTGTEKREVLLRAQRDADPMRLPIAALLHAPGAKVEIHWSP
jgi:6-phosphogluconolactonase